MRHPWLNSRYAQPIVVALLFISSLLPPGAAALVSHLPDNFVSAVMSPINRPLHLLSLRMRGPDSAQADDQPVDRERLNRQVRQLQERLERAQETIRQLSGVQKRLQWVEPRFPHAEVTATNPHPSWPTITISRGRVDGVEVDLVACAGSDLVGHVISRTEFSATVALLTQLQAYFEVRFVPSDLSSNTMSDLTHPLRRTAAQLVYDADKHVFVTDLGVDAARAVRQGDEAILADPRWPRHAHGLTVGVVQSVVPHNADPARQRHVYVKPRVDLLRLAQVIVLMPPTPGDAD